MTYKIKVFYWADNRRVNRAVYVVDTSDMILNYTLNNLKVLNT
ncbi:hypothetical protein LCAC16_PC10007 [Leuconostoc carnosum]|nr:hypothetical protein LCAC16_PC10007 [Leuconostoc carnosum]